MQSALFAFKYFVCLTYGAAIAYVHLRGHERLKLLRQIFNHSSLIAPYNALMYLFSAVPAQPLLKPAAFPQLRTLEDEWQTIRDEALKLADDGYIRIALHNNDIGFNSFFKRGWKRFYLKWYDEPLPSARALCPKTVALLGQVPEIHGAMIASLAPHSRLNPHRDPYAGSLRYHLGLVTPNSPDCYISVDGEKYHWRDGEGILFDETYIHYVENNTDETRYILLCDFERPLKSRLLTAVNRWVSRTIVRASGTQNVEHERVGAINRAYANVYHPVADVVHRLASRLKQKNRTAYRAVKVALITGVLLLIVL